MEGSLVATRKARLREDYADWYPRISPGTWHDAAWVTEVVLQQQRQGSPVWAVEGRVLSEAHFEFQGGDYLPPTGAERRRAVSRG
jgi:hypothetical protein